MLHFLSVKFSWMIREVSYYFAETTLKYVKRTIILRHVGANRSY